MSKWNEIMRLHIILPIAETIKGTCAYKWLRTIKQMQSWTPEQVVEFVEEIVNPAINEYKEQIGIKIDLNV